MISFGQQHAEHPRKPIIIIKAENTYNGAAKSLNSFNSDTTAANIATIKRIKLNNIRKLFKSPNKLLEKDPHALVFPSEQNILK